MQLVAFWAIEVNSRTLSESIGLLEFETEELVAVAPGGGELKKAVILGIDTEGGGIVYVISSAV